MSFKETYINGIHCVAYEDGRLWTYNSWYKIYKLVSLNKLDKGYLNVKIKGRTYKQHRIIYRCFHEDFDINNPKICIDHIDKNKTNNAVTNLRIATYAENLRNVSIRKANSSGHKGIRAQYRKDKKYWQWRIEITKNRKTKQIYSKMRPQPDIEPGEKFDYYRYPVPEHIIKLCRETRKKLHGEFACHC